MKKVQAPITVLVAAVGGQGGQLFSQWLFDAAREAGFFPVGVGLPGLSQREGATAYYLEFFAEPEATALFSPFPEKGQVQVLIGLELLELMRTVREGYLAPDGIILGSTHRILTAEEKLLLKGGFLSAEQAVPVLHQVSRQCLVYDAVQAAALAGLSERAANAILFGTLAASGILPFPPEAFRRAIEHYGVAVAFNLRAFDFGTRYREWLLKLQMAKETTVNEWEALPEPSLPKPLVATMEALSADDEELGFILRHAARWLCHYQDARYFARYLDQVRLVYEQDRLLGKGLLVTKEVARILAVRMAYEDAVRVAQMKTARHRFVRLRQEHGLEEQTVYRVVDFFSPDWDELTGLLPFPKREAQEEVEEGLPSLPSQAEELRRPALQLRVETSSLVGHLLLRGLLLFKPLRPYSRRFQKEWAAIQEWLAAVREALREDYDLAFLIARSGELVRGYGRTRRKTLAAWRALLTFLRRLKQQGLPTRTVVALGEEFLAQALSGPQGPECAWQFAREQLARRGE